MTRHSSLQGVFFTVFKGYLSFVLLLVCLLACNAANVTANESFGLALPEQGQYYHGVYPGGVSGEEDDISLEGLVSYETAVGRKAAWVYFSHNWYQNRSFPLETVSWIKDSGSVPFIRLMLRSSAEIYTEETVFSLENIVNGVFDSDLEAWGKAAAAFKSPLIVEWGAEMNGDWFSWSGAQNQQDTDLFKQSYRHIVSTIKAQGASNITWVFHVNAYDFPEEPWNTFEAYYPGDDVVDWLGVSLYAAQAPFDDYWDDFTEALDTAIPRFNALSNTKPVFVLEFGAPAANPLGDPAIWADDALKAILSNRWDSLKGFSWWNETWQNEDYPNQNTDMQVQTVANLADVFQSNLANTRVLERFISLD